jgi:hypothetical protein
MIEVTPYNRAPNYKDFTIIFECFFRRNRCLRTAHAFEPILGQRHMFRRRRPRHRFPFVFLSLSGVDIFHRQHISQRTVRTEVVDSKPTKVSCHGLKYALQDARLLSALGILHTFFTLNSKLTTLILITFRGFQQVPSTITIIYITTYTHCFYL